MDPTLFKISLTKENYDRKIEIMRSCGLFVTTRPTKKFEVGSKYIVEHDNPDHVWQCTGCVEANLVTLEKVYELEGFDSLPALLCELENLYGFAIPGKTWYVFFFMRVV